MYNHTPCGEREQSRRRAIDKRRIANASFTALHANCIESAKSWLMQMNCRFIRNMQPRAYRYQLMAEHMENSDRRAFLQPKDRATNKTENL